MTTLATADRFSAAPALTGLLAQAVRRLADWNDARVTRATLSRLSAHELDDIGLCRGDIESIAARTRR